MAGAASKEDPSKEEISSILLSKLA